LYNYITMHDVKKYKIRINVLEINLTKADFVSEIFCRRKYYHKHILTLTLILPTWRIW